MRIQKSLITITILLLLSPLILRNGFNVYSGIKNSHHDFSGRTWNPDHKYCEPCHTPHNANMEVPNSPLWNHAVTSASFEVYVSSTLDAAVGQPSGKSKLCLSCHDGTVSVNSYGGVTGTNHIMPWQNGYLGTDLKNDHPVSFAYSSALASADGELEDPNTALSGLGGTIAEDLLENGRMECSSCHDVHASRNDQGCNGCHNMHGGSFLKQDLTLRVDNSQSAFCLTCHKK
ncbi:MAG: cytochrome C [Chlorobi bacterium]|nr:cytochrome C [Chlorobiota bacterium]